MGGYGGFRPLSVHSALRSIYSKGQTYSWVVQGEINKCFDIIPHSTVIKCLREHIADEAFIDLVRKFLSAGYIYPYPQKGETGLLRRARFLLLPAPRGPPPGVLKHREVKSAVGVTQGGVMSPILCNIVLHKFDDFMARMMQKFDKGKVRRRNPEYQRLEYRRRSFWAPAAKNQGAPNPVPLGGTGEKKRYLLRHPLSSSKREVILSLHRRKLPSPPLAPSPLLGEGGRRGEYVMLW